MSRSRKNLAPTSVHLVRDNSLQRWAPGLMSKQGAPELRRAESNKYAKNEEQSKWYQCVESKSDRRRMYRQELLEEEKEKDRERARELDSAKSVTQGELPTMEHWDLVKTNPMGRLLLQCVRDNMLLKEKVGCSDGLDIDLGAFCTAFYNKASIEKKDLEDTLKHTAHSSKHDLIERKGRSHHESNVFPAPTHFSSHDTLTTPILLSHNAKLFPFGSCKFSGCKSKDSKRWVSVMEFLGIMNRSQEIAKLSKKEFMIQLLTSTTDKANYLVIDGIANGKDIKEIYHSLILNSTRRMSGEKSRARLANYKAQKASSLAKVEIGIRSLASSSRFPQGKSQQSLYNLEATVALIRALPPVSSAIASNTLATLNSELGRAATFMELSRALHIYRHTIDQDIFSNGSVDRDKAVASSGTTAVKKTWGKNKGKAAPYGLSAGQVEGKLAKKGKKPNLTRQNDGPNQAPIAYRKGKLSRNPNQDSGHQGHYQGQGQQGQFQGQGHQGQPQDHSPPQRDGTGRIRGKSRGTVHDITVQSTVRNKNATHGSVNEALFKLAGYKNPSATSFE